MDGSNLQPQQNWIAVNSSLLLTPLILQPGLMEIIKKKIYESQKVQRTEDKYQRPPFIVILKKKKKDAFLVSQVK